MASKLSDPPQPPATSGDVSADNDDNANETSKLPPSNDDDTTITTTKRKRRKVRSRQKNIRKDTRPSSQKPEFLRLRGRTESVAYGGRPLTQATRDLWKMPESRSSVIRNTKKNGDEDGVLGLSTEEEGRGGALDVEMEGEGDHRVEQKDDCDDGDDTGGNDSSIKDVDKDVDNGEILNDTLGVVVEKGEGNADSPPVIDVGEKYEQLTNKLNYVAGKAKDFEEGKNKPKRSKAKRKKSKYKNLQ